MLMSKETEEKFGYSAKSLSKGSNRKVIVKCDYCNSICEKGYKEYNKGREIIEKDSCKKCRYKKRADMSMKQHGVSNSAQRSEVRKKISENCPFNNEETKAKIKQTMLNRYGVVNPMHSDELKEKHKEIIQDKYGVDNISQVSEFREQARKTNLEKYGNEEFLASDEGKSRKLEGVRKKYGVDNVFQSEEIKEKSKQTSLEKYGVDHHLKDSIRAKEHAKKVLDSKIDNGMVKLYKGKPISEWLKESEFSNSRFRALIHKHGFEKAICMNPRMSSLEQVTKMWLDQENIDYEQQFRVDNKIADFYLQDHDVIIEVDGLYWHSELFLDKDYHMAKRQLYIDSGYRPLFFRSDEIENKFNIIESILRNACRINSNRIFARKCGVGTLIPSKSTVFFNNNHLMGGGRGLTYTLIYDNNIVSAMRIVRLHNNDYEISRFCITLNTSVIGGFSKLLTHFLRNNDVTSLITFVDKRYGSGNYLHKLGFVENDTHLSFRWTNGVESFHRMKFPSNTGYDAGLIKIWDCGQTKYTYIM